MIVSTQIYELVRDYFDFTEILEKKTGHKSQNAPFYLVNSITKKIKNIADAILLSSNLRPDEIDKIKQSIMHYVPVALQPYIALDQEKWGSELRKLSVMFLSIGIDLNDA